MSEWAKKAAEQLAKEDVQKALSHQVYVQQRAQLTAEVPYLKEELKASLFREVTALGKLRPNFLTMDADYQGMTEITLKSEKVTMVISFDAAAQKINTRFRNAAGSYSGTGGYIFEISNRKVGLTNQYLRSASVADATEELLNQLI